MAILITGSKKGLGCELVTMFRKAGKKVIRHSRLAHIKNHRKEKNSEIFCDLLELNELESELYRLKNNNVTISHLICNAGKSSYPQHGIENIKNIPSAISDNLVVTTNSVYSVIKVFGDTLKTVTIIGSICGEEVIPGAPLEYSVAKSALNAFTKICSHKYSNLGIRFNLITPGNLLFEGSVWHRKKIENEKAYENYLIENVPSKTIGEPLQIFKAIDFLISEHSTFVNGGNLIIDGSQTRKW